MTVLAKSSVMQVHALIITDHGQYVNGRITSNRTYDRLFPSLDPISLDPTSMRPAALVIIYSDQEDLPPYASTAFG